MKTYKGKTIRMRADGRWWARFYDKNGKQRSVYGRTQNECLQKLKQAMKDDVKAEVDEKNIALGQWIKRWLDVYKSQKVCKSTLDQMVRYLKQLPESLSRTAIKNVTATMLQEWFNSIDKLRKREKIFTYLKDAFTKALKIRLIEYSPFDALENTKRKRKQSSALTSEEEQIFVQVCKQSQYGNLYLMLLYQGLRIGEALALTYEDIDFKKRTISISKSINDAGELVAPKTETSIRTIPLFSRTLAMLTPGGAGRIFTYKRTVYQNKIAIMRRRIGIENVSAHTLRHTFATRCAEAGIPPKVVQKWLGHATIDMTLNVYTHVNQDFEQEMVVKFDTHFDT